MGDCRIRILIVQDLIVCKTENNDSNEGSSSASTNNKDEWQVILNKTFSSDTTVREVCEDSNCKAILLPLLEEGGGGSLFDCTIHPPRDISDWPVATYSEVKGLKSKTLYDAGWFPSGMLRVVPSTSERSPESGVPLILASTASLQHDDAQYNRQLTSVGTSSAPAELVQLKTKDGDTTTKSSARMLPSQVLDSVKNRFEQDGDGEDEEKARQLRRQNQQMQKQKEKERFQRLEGRIRRLEKQQQKSNKNKRVSDQVRNMLIKSRATGASTLKPHDRIYFHVVMDFGELIAPTDDDTGVECAEDYRYFSIQDTASRMIATFDRPASLPADAVAEMLVGKQISATSEDPTTKIYRRFPGTMRVYELIEKKHFMKDFNEILIRWYSPVNEEPTTSILDDDISSEGETQHSESAKRETTDPLKSAAEDTLLTASDNSAALVAASATTAETTASESNAVQRGYDRLVDLIHTMDESQPKTSKKKASSKASSTSSKVRQMLIKSKAKGDGKRIKMEERFFFEVITAHLANDDESDSSCISYFCYLSKKDQLGRIVRDCVPAQASKKWEGNSETDLLVASEKGGTCAFSSLANLSMTFQEAEANKLLDPFDRLVVRIQKNT